MKQTMKKKNWIKFLIDTILIFSGFFAFFWNTFVEKSEENDFINPQERTAETAWWKGMDTLQDKSYQTKKEVLKNDFNIKAIDYAINGFIILFLFLDIYLYLVNTKEKRKIEKELRKFNNQYPVVINFTPPKEINAIEAGLLVDEYPSERILDTLFYKWQRENLIFVETRKLKNPFRYELIGNISIFYQILIWFWLIIIPMGFDIGGYVDPLFRRGIWIYRAVVIGLWFIFVPLAYRKTKKNGNYKTLVTKLKEIPTSYPQYEKGIFTDFFWNDKDGKVNLFNVCLIDREKAKKNLKRYGYEKNRFKKERDVLPRKQVNRISILQVSIISLWWAVVLAYTVWFWLNVRILYLLFCGTFFVCVLDTHVQNYTEEWYKLRNYLLWYRQFLKKCELPKRRAIFKDEKEDIDLIVEYTMIFGLTPQIKKKIEKIIKWPEYSILDYKNLISHQNQEYDKRKEYYKQYFQGFESKYDDEFN